LEVSSAQLVRGHFDVITIRTEAYPPEPLELEVGPFVHNLDSDADEPIVVVEVGLDDEQLDVQAWVALLAKQLNTIPDRIEIVSTRRMGIASLKSDITEFGTRVEMRFSSPTTDTRSRASSKELARVLVSMAQPCDAPDLHIFRKYFADTVSSSCDLFQLADQMIGVQRCLDTTQQLCSCHVHMFEALGTACSSTDHFLDVCSAVTNCLSSAIRNGCDSYKIATYTAYAMVGVYALLFLLLAGAVVAYRKELVQKCLREKLSRRMNRDEDFPGLQIVRQSTERAEPLDLI
jgi:hypothetical protein